MDGGAAGEHAEAGEPPGRTVLVAAAGRWVRWLAEREDELALADPTVARAPQMHNAGNRGRAKRPEGDEP